MAQYRELYLIIDPSTQSMFDPVIADLRKHVLGQRRVLGVMTDAALKHGPGSAGAAIESALGVPHIGRFGGDTAWSTLRTAAEAEVPDQVGALLAVITSRQLQQLFVQAEVHPDELRHLAECVQWQSDQRDVPKGGFRTLPGAVVRMRWQLDEALSAGTRTSSSSNPFGLVKTPVAATGQMVPHVMLTTMRLGNDDRAEVFVAAPDRHRLGLSRTASMDKDPLELCTVRLGEHRISVYIDSRIRIVTLDSLGTVVQTLEGAWVGFGGDSSDASVSILMRQFGESAARVVLDVALPVRAPTLAHTLRQLHAQSKRTPPLPVVSKLPAAAPPKPAPTLCRRLAAISGPAAGKLTFSALAAIEPYDAADPVAFLRSTTWAPFVVLEQDDGSSVNAFEHSLTPTQAAVLGNTIEAVSAAQIKVRPRGWRRGLWESHTLLFASIHDGQLRTLAMEDPTNVPLLVCSSSSGVFDSREPSEHTEALSRLSHSSAAASWTRVPVDRTDVVMPWLLS